MSSIINTLCTIPEQSSVLFRGQHWKDFQTSEVHELLIFLLLALTGGPHGAVHWETGNLGVRIPDPFRTLSIPDVLYGIVQNIFNLIEVKIKFSKLYFYWIWKTFELKNKNKNLSN